MARKKMRSIANSQDEEFRKAAVFVELFNKYIFPPRGRPREYEECPLYRNRSHRWEGGEDYCKCGYTKEPQELFLKLRVMINGHKQYRVSRAVMRLKEFVDERCDPKSNEVFTPR